MPRLGLRFFLLVLCFTAQFPVFAYNTTDSVGHNWLLDKALQFLDSQQGSITHQFPLHKYTGWIKWGMWYADNSEDKCEWGGIPGRDDLKYSCDQIHHYGKIGAIRAYSAGAPSDGITVAHTGEFAAPFYADVLYNQALLFQPGGPKPNLESLPYKRAGYITAVFSGQLLESTYVGGLPLCELYSLLEENSTLISYRECPKWPKWVAIDDDGKKTEESVELSMKYLGWALHLVHDLTIAYHVNNEASDSHQSYEDKGDEWIKNGDFNHLPIYDAKSYRFKPCNRCVDGEYWYNVVDEELLDGTIENIANVCANIAKNTDNGKDIQPSFDSYKSDYDLMWEKSIAERCLDAAIKATVKILNDFFSNSELEKDAFEVNDTRNQAKLITPGIHDLLSIHNGADEDWFKFTIPTEDANTVIDIYYDGNIGTLSSEVEYEGSPGIAEVPESTSFGLRIDMREHKTGTYLLHINSFDQRSVPYKINFMGKSGEIVPDKYEENDSPDKPSLFITTLPDGCPSPDEIATIDKNGDDDYYYIEAEIGMKITAFIEFAADSCSLELYINDKVAPLRSTFDGITYLSVSECKTGRNDPIIRVTGDKCKYDICIMRVSSGACTVKNGTMQENIINQLKTRLIDRGMNKYVIQGTEETYHVSFFNLRGNRLFTIKVKSGTMFVLPQNIRTNNVVLVKIAGSNNSLVADKKVICP